MVYLNLRMLPSGGIFCFKIKIGKNMLRQEQKMHKQNMENLTQLSHFEKNAFSVSLKSSHLFQEKTISLTL